MRDVQERRRAPSQRQLENINLLLAGGALVIGAVVGLVMLDDLTQFAGAGVRSVAETAAISSAVLSGLVFLGMLLAHQGRVLPWYGEVHPLRRWFNLFGLTLLIGSLTLFLLRGLGRVAAAAFIGLRLDTYSGATFIAATCALSVYFAAGIAGQLNTESLSVLVSGFLVLGAMMSAVNASDQEWWRVHFSALGMTPDLSGFAFNFTLVLTGIVVITLADFLTHDMRSWLE
ncbi:MAG: hypothetical protein GX596_12370, partial [Propionibacterium sp.]|nr:hypothetical protein [Propionibacterium sp.]